MQYIIEIVDGSPSGHPLQLDNAIVADVINLTTQNKYVLSSDLVDSGYGLFIFDEPQRNDDSLKEYVEVTPYYQNQDGEWVQAYELRDITFENDVDRQAAIADNLRKQKNDIRSKRNALLKQSDFTQISDATLSKSEWSAYRSLLRDITDQETFSTGTVTWPEPPSELDVD